MTILPHRPRLTGAAEEIFLLGETVRGTPDTNENGIFSGDRKMTERPNLFQYATSELTQDAFLCWLLAWAERKCADADPALHFTAVNFLRSMLEKCDHSLMLYDDKPLALRIKPVKQYKFIYILAKVDYGKDKYAIVIEDKINTTMHGNQLKRYRNIIEAKYPRRTCLFVYLKTGAMSRAQQAKKAGYVVYPRTDLLKVLEKREGKISNHIYMDFLAHLREKHKNYSKFIECKVIDWVNSWSAWQGFFECLQERLGSGHWGYAANQAGGELIFYCDKTKIFDGYVYAQINKKLNKKNPNNSRYFLAFKVSNVPHDRDRRNVRKKMYLALMKAAKDHGWGDYVEKPQRFGYGNSMVFCETKNQSCWLVQNADGKLNFGETVKRLELANKILLVAAANYSGNDGR